LEGFVQPREGRQSFTVLVDLPPLIPGEYWVSPWVGSHNTETLDMIHQCAAFEVSRSPTPGRSFPHTIDHGYIVPSSRLAPTEVLDPQQSSCQTMPQGSVITQENNLTKALGCGHP